MAAHRVQSGTPNVFALSHISILAILPVVVTQAFVAQPIPYAASCKPHILYKFGQISRSGILLMYKYTSCIQSGSLPSYPPFSVDNHLNSVDNPLKTPCFPTLEEQSGKF
jgi:hypothetical protein